MGRRRVGGQTGAALDLPTASFSFVGVTLLTFDSSCSISMAIGTTIRHLPISPSVTDSSVSSFTYPGTTNPGEWMASIWMTQHPSPARTIVCLLLLRLPLFGTTPLGHSQGSMSIIVAVGALVASSPTPIHWGKSTFLLGRISFTVKQRNKSGMALSFSNSSSEMAASMAA